MCDPTGITWGTALALAGTAVSTGLQQYGQQQQSKALSSAYEDADKTNAATVNQERERQDQYQQQAQQIFNNSMGQIDSGKVMQDQESVAAQLGKQYGGVADQAQNASIPGIGLGGVGGELVQKGYKDSLNSVGQYLRQQAQAKAALDATTNTNLANNIAISNNSQGLGLLNNFMQGSAKANQYQLNANNTQAQYNYGQAGQAGQDWTSAGYLTSALGNSLAGTGGKIFKKTQ